MEAINAKGCLLAYNTLAELNTILLNLDTAFSVNLVLNRQANGVQAMPNDIYTTSTSDKTFVKIEENNRFKVLKHWHVEPVVTIDHTRLTGVTGKVMITFALPTVQYYRKMNLPIRYSNASTETTITDIEDNNLFYTINVENATMFDWAFKERTRINYES